MELRTNVFDLWPFVRTDDGPRYLLLHTSQEKADRFFGGGRFWQIPGGFLEEGQDVVDAARGVLDELGLEATAIWAVEHVYLIYNRRHRGLEAISVFAAELPDMAEPSLTWEHSEQGWFRAAECYERLTYRGLREGLDRLREFVTESEARPEYRLA